MSLLEWIGKWGGFVGIVGFIFLWIADAVIWRRRAAKDAFKKRPLFSEETAAVLRSGDTVLLVIPTLVSFSKGAFEYYEGICGDMRSRGITLRAVPKLMIDGVVVFKQPPIASESGICADGSNQNKP